MSDRSELLIETGGWIDGLLYRLKSYFLYPFSFFEMVRNSISLRDKNRIYRFIGEKIKRTEAGAFHRIIRLPTFKGNYYVISNVEYIREVLKHPRLEKGAFFGEGRQLRVLSEATGRYRMSKGRADSKQKRNIMAKLLSNSQRYLPKMLEECERLVERWGQQKGEIVIDKDIACFSVALYMRSIFNYQGQIEPIAPILQAQINLLGDGLAYRGAKGDELQMRFKAMRTELMRYLADDEGVQTTTEYTSALSDYIEGHYKNIAQEAFETGLNGAALMGYLAPYPSFLMLVYELGRHEELKKELHKEWCQWEREDETTVIDYIKSEKTFLHAFVHEVLRLHPPQPLVFRMCVRDINFKGVFMKKGSQVLLNLYHALRDPGVWGKDAEDFNPQRFMECPELYKRPYIAYSSGPNNCSGQIFSRLSMKALLMTLVKGLSFDTCGGNISHCFHFAMEFDREVHIKL